MSVLKDNYKRIMSEIEQKITNTEDLEYVKEKVSELSMIFMDVIDNLTNVEALEIVKRYNDGEFNVSKYVDKVVSIDVDELKQDILNEASLRTYEAYGRKQLEFAINNLINNKKFNGFVNDDNVRLHLINKVSPDEVKNIIKNDLLSNNYPGSIIQEKYITLYINKIEKEAKG